MSLRNCDSCPGGLSLFRWVIDDDLQSPACGVNNEELEVELSSSDTLRAGRIRVGPGCTGGKPQGRKLLGSSRHLSGGPGEEMGLKQL